MHTLLSSNIQKSIFISFLVVTLFFIFYPHYLPMVDLPQHAAQITTLDDLLKNRSPWHNMLTINWDTPYLVVYGAWLFLYQFIDINLSSKVIVAFIFLFYVWSVRLVRKAFNGEHIVDWIGLTCFFGFAFQWGFISFLMGIPVGLVFLATNKFWLDTQNKRYLPIILLLGICLYLSHILTFAFFCFLSFLCFLTKIKGIQRQQSIAYMLIYFVFAAIFARYLLKPNPEPFLIYPAGKLVYHDIWHKTKAIFYMPWNMIDLYYYDFACYALFILPYFLGYRLRKDILPYILLLGTLLIWYALPHIGFQTAYVYQRFALFIPLFYYFLWQKQAIKMEWQLQLAKRGSLCFLICIGLLMHKVYYNHFEFAHFPEVKTFREIITQIKPKKRMLGMYTTSSLGNGGLTYDMEYLHFAQWYQAERQGWVDYSFSSAHAMVVRLKSDFIYPHYHKNRHIDEITITEKLDCSPYDYILIRSNFDLNKIMNTLHAISSCKHMVVQTHQMDWVLLSPSSGNK